MAPGPLPRPGPGHPSSLDEPHVQPYYLRETQPWAVQQERMRHNQAMWQVGENAMFVLMWHISDLKSGLVRRCPKCYGRDEPSQIKRRIAETYNQPEEHRCPECFGTTFEGGFKARIIRPAIFSDSDEDEQKAAKGVVTPQSLSVESTTDFRVRTGDYAFRATGERYQLRVPQRITLRTGFAVPSQSDAAIGYNHSRANEEDPTSVAYLIPPTPEVVSSLLTAASRVPVDFSEYEVIRAPLIPKDND